MREDAHRPRVVIVGTGVDLNMVAFALAQKLKHRNPEITALDVGGPKPPVLCSTFSDMAEFNSSFGVSESELINSIGAGLNFGLLLNGRSDRSPFIFSDSPYGLMLHKQPFHQLFHLYRQENSNAKLDDFCLSAVLAKAGRVAPKSENASSVFSSVNYGYTFLTDRYERFLRAHAVNSQVNFVPANSLELTETGGKVDSLTTNNGQVYEADLFIDCSSERTLIGKREGNRHCAHVIKEDYIPPWQYSHSNERLSDPEWPLYAEIHSVPNGFCKRIKYGHSTSVENYVFEEEGSSNERAEVKTTCHAAILRRPWADNCVGIGAAFTNTPNLLPGGYNLIQGQIFQLLDLWLGGPVGAASAEIFNQTSVQTGQHLVDLINIQLTAHPILSSNVRVTDSNHQRVELFTSSGAAYISEDSIVTDQHWFALLTGLGFEQRGGSLSSTGITSSNVAENLNKLKALFQRAASGAQPYRSWLNATM